MHTFLPKLTPFALLVAGLGATVARAQAPMIMNEGSGAPVGYLLASPAVAPESAGLDPFLTLDQMMARQAALMAAQARQMNALLQEAVSARSALRSAPDNQTMGARVYQRVTVITFDGAGAPCARTVTMQRVGQAQPVVQISQAGGAHCQTARSAVPRGEAVSPVAGRTPGVAPAVMYSDPVSQVRGGVL